MYSDSSSFDRPAKMSQDELNWQNRGVQQGKPPPQKLPKKNQSPNPPSVPPQRRRPPPRGEQSPPALSSQVLSLFAFATSCRAKNYLQDYLQFVHLHISETTPGPSGTQRQTTPGTSQGCQPAAQKHSLGAATAGR